MQLALALPSGWRALPEVARTSVQPAEEASTKVTIQIPHDFPTEPSRVAITADVLADGRYLGQIAEAVIDLQTIGESRA